MKKASLQINPEPVKIQTYQFSEVVVKANPNFDSTGTSQGSRVKISTNIHQGENKELYQIELRIMVLVEEGENVPYEIVMTCYAVVSADPDTDYSTDQNNVFFASVIHFLYSACREMAANITSRGPWPKFILPFIKIESQAEDIEIQFA